MEMKPIETRYHGHKFRSRLEARWAVFFDACGIEWEYEPQGYDLGDGVCYLPDFLLHGVIVPCYWLNDEGALYVEVKGKMTDDDAKKIKLFSRINPIFVVGGIPTGRDAYEMYSNILFGSDEAAEVNKWPKQFNAETVLGFDTQLFPCISKADWGGTLALTEGDSEFLREGLDWDATLAAYRRASEARFEHGESPETRRV